MIFLRIKPLTILLLVAAMFSACDKKDENIEVVPPNYLGEYRVSEYIRNNIKYEFVYDTESKENKIETAFIYERANSYSNWSLWGKMEIEYEADNKVTFLNSQYFNPDWEVVSKKVLTFENDHLKKGENFNSSGLSFVSLNKSEYFYENEKLIEKIYSHDLKSGLEPFKRYTYTWENGNPRTKKDFDSPSNGWDWTGHCDTINFDNGLISEIIHYTEASNPFNKKVFVYENNKISQIKLMLFNEEIWEEHSSNYFNYDTNGNLISVYFENSLSEAFSYTPGIGNFTKIFNFDYVWQTWVPRPQKTNTNEIDPFSLEQY